MSERDEWDERAEKLLAKWSVSGHDYSGFIQVISAALREQAEAHKAEVEQIKFERSEAECGAFESGMLLAREGDQIVYADLDSGVDDNICKIRWYEDRGDPSVGLAGWAGWVLIPDQSNTELDKLRAELAVRDNQITQLLQTNDQHAVEIIRLKEWLTAAEAANHAMREVCRNDIAEIARLKAGQHDLPPCAHGIWTYETVSGDIVCGWCELISEHERLERDYEEQRQAVIDLRAQIAHLKKELEDQKEYGREYIAKTDPMLACADDPENGTCGDCRECYWKKIRDQEAEIAHLKQALADAAQEARK